MWAGGRPRACHAKTASPSPHATVLLGRDALEKGVRLEECISQFDTSADGLIDLAEFEALFSMLIDKGLLPRPRHPR